MIEKDEKLGETYGPIELAIECAKAKAGGDAYRFNRIRAVILDIRPVIETELRRKDKGMKPPPDEVLEKLLTPMPGEPVTVVTQTVWKKPKVKTRVQQTNYIETDEFGTNPVSDLEFDCAARGEPMQPDYDANARKRNLFKNGRLQIND